MPTYDVRKEPLEPQHALVIHAEILPHEIGDKLREILPKVHEHIKQSGLEVAGAPFTRYNGFGDKLDIEAGIPIKSAGTSAGEIEAIELPGGEAAITTHIGPYDELPQAHAALISWSHANQRAANGGTIEQYVTDPADQPDATKLETRVVLPLVDG